MRRWFLLLVLFLAVQQVGFSRIFTNLQGKKINGEIQSVSGDRVEMKVGTKRFIFPIATLVEVDQTFIKKWAKENKSYKLTFTADDVEDPNGRTEGKSPAPGRNSPRTRARVGSDMKGSKWGYNVRIQNRSGENLENLTVKYLVAVRTTVSDSAKSGKDRTTESFVVKEGVTTVQQIENSKAATISTDWIDCTETKWEEQRIIHKRDAEGDAYTEEILAKLKEDMEIDGIRIKVFLGDREVAEWESQGKTIKEAAWKNQGVPGQANAGKAAPQILIPVGSQGEVRGDAPVLYHKDLDPVPATLPKHKGDKAHSRLWFAVIRLAREYASASENRKPSSERRKIKEKYDEALKEFVAANQ